MTLTLILDVWMVWHKICLNAHVILCYIDTTGIKIGLDSICLNGLAHNAPQMHSSTSWRWEAAETVWKLPMRCIVVLQCVYIVFSLVFHCFELCWQSGSCPWWLLPWRAGNQLLSFRTILASDKYLRASFCWIFWTDNIPRIVNDRKWIKWCNKIKNEKEEDNVENRDMEKTITWIASDKSRVK